jgi:hypothetical protein
MPAAMFFLVGAFIAASNAWGALRSLRQRANAQHEQETQEKPPAPIPLAGGVLMVIGMLSAPISSLHTFAWLPLFVDYGCLPTVGRALALSLFGKPQRGELVALKVDVDPAHTLDPAETSHASKSTLPNGQFDGDGASPPR